MVRISAFEWVPPFAQGAVRDFRVRWALEEAGIPYEVRLLRQGDQKSADYRALQPFGQVPSFEDGDVTLFESGAIVLHIAEKCDTLLPKDDEGRSRARAWVIAALNTIEPPIMELAGIDFFWTGQHWTAERRPMVEEAIRERLGELSNALGKRDYLEDDFTAGDLMMSAVLRTLKHTEILADYPSLVAYRARCEARPAFRRAIDAQMADFKEKAA